MNKCTQHIQLILKVVSFKESGDKVRETVALEGANVKAATGREEAAGALDAHQVEVEEAPQAAVAKAKAHPMRAKRAAPAAALAASASLVPPPWRRTRRTSRRLAGWGTERLRAKGQ